MATNPLRQVILNGRHYNYTPGSYRASASVKNSSTETQNSRTFSLQGVGFDTHSVTLVLESIYYPREGNSVLLTVSGGATTWFGTSRYADLKGFLTGRGLSMPITFVSPDGLTHSVIPTGSIDREEYLGVPGEESGIEWRVTLTLEDTADV